MRAYALVAVGAACGAALRWGLGVWWSPDGGVGALTEFPTATFVVNVVGCASIGIAARQLDRASKAWLFVVPGVLGGLTTFSTFSVETRQLLDTGRFRTAAAYVAATLVAGQLAVAIARQVGRR